jgi:hypothetical protein
MQKRLNGVLSGDPGVNTGWAYWNGKRLPERTGVFRCVSRKNRVVDFYEQLNDLWLQWYNVVSFLTPRHVVLESSEWRPDSVKSTIAERKGDLRKLAVITGGYCAIANRLGATWELVHAVTWKGQLTDAALRAQLKVLIKREYRRHEQEAVGIGLWKAGEL